MISCLVVRSVMLFAFFRMASISRIAAFLGSSKLWRSECMDCSISNFLPVRKHAMKTHSSAGPSGLDADDWLRLLSAFGQTSTNLYKLVAKFAKRLAKSIIPPDDLIAYNVCQLVALNKCPVVRPIGIGEVMRRITGRKIVDCIKQDLTALSGNMQLCLGQKCGIEHAIHLLRHSFDDPENDSILLIEAKNAFNVLNR